MAGPFPYPEHPFPEPLPQQPFPAQPPPALYPHDGGPSPYPGQLPPPVNYPGRPGRRRFGLLALALVAMLAVAVVAATIVFTQHRESTATATVTDASAKTAIQGYLDALLNGDKEKIARNASCGLYDALKDRKSDLALADLASDAFRRQFSKVDVTTIDKIVFGTPTQAQVLFTMRAVPTGRQQGNVERQGVVQLIAQGPDVLVCSYLLRVGL
jgi:hypothetical protein